MNQRQMDQFTNQFPSPGNGIIHHSPSYNFYPPFTAGHVRPDIGQMRPDIGHMRPDIGHMRPDIGHLRPDIGQMRPDMSHVRSDIGHVRPDIGHIRPDMSHVRSDMGHVRPDIGHIRPDMSHVRSDIGHVRPVISHMRPDIGLMRPELGYSQCGLPPRPPNMYMYPGAYNHPRPTLYPQDMHQAAIQREMEKQRIREEIMKDMAMRREIEEEVRRELKMEAELAQRTGIPLGLSPPVMGTSGLAITGSLLENRIALSDEERIRREDKGLEITPFQRGKNVNMMISAVDPVLERGKEKKKIFLMAKPGTNTSGSKRKAETPPVVDASDEPQPSLIFKRKDKKEWTCTLCQISASSEHGLNEHLQGKKHKSKETASRKNRTGKNYVIGLLSNTTTKSTDIASEPLQKEPEVTAKVQNGGGEEKKFRYWCEICKVGAHSMTVMQNHKDGKTHLKRMSKKKSRVVIEEMDGGSGKQVETEAEVCGGTDQVVCETEV